MAKYKLKRITRSFSVLGDLGEGVENITGIQMR